MAEPRSSSTPRTIQLAIPLLLFAFASPWLGSFISDHTPGEDQMILGAFVMWMLAGLGAGLLGVACTAVGAWRGPRSGFTILAMVLAALLAGAVCTFSVLLLR
jgi:hypothetical protein